MAHHGGGGGHGGSNLDSLVPPTGQFTALVGCAAALGAFWVALRYPFTAIVAALVGGGIAVVTCLVFSDNADPSTHPLILLACIVAAALLPSKPNRKPNHGNTDPEE